MSMKPIIQIFIAIIILIACFKLGEIKGRYQIKELTFGDRTEIIDEITQPQKELTDFAQKQKEFYRKTHNGY